MQQHFKTSPRAPLAGRAQSFRPMPTMLHKLKDTLRGTAAAAASQGNGAFKRVRVPLLNRRGKSHAPARLVDARARDPYPARLRWRMFGRARLTSRVAHEQVSQVDRGGPLPTLALTVRGC